MQAGLQGVDRHPGAPGDLCQIQIGKIAQRQNLVVLAAQRAQGGA
jgi:hypothetical protein